MHERYDDIRRRIKDPILWWDEYFVPRYDPFSPSISANGLANECALVVVECQNCGHRFNVAMSQSLGQEFDLAASIRSKTLIDLCDHPPNITCCDVGPSMCSIPVKVLEYWKRGGILGIEWKRDATLEVAVDPWP